MEEILYYDTKCGELNIGVKDEHGYSLKVTQSHGHNEYGLQMEHNQIFNKKIIIIDSSKSGVGRNKRDMYEPIIKPIFKKLNLDHEYILTESFDTIKTVSETLKSGDYLVILISGDTSVNEFINSVNHESTGDITIFNIPFGTGNSLGLSLDLKNELYAFSKLLLNKGSIKPFNLYDVTLPKDTWLLQQDEKVMEMPLNYKFIVVFSWGFHASLVADSDTPELRKHGIDRFKMAAMKNLESVQQYNGETIVSSVSDTRKFEGPYGYWLLTPSKKFEPTFEISPRGDIFDDTLFLISFKSGVDIMSVMQQVYTKGEHINNPDVTYEHIVKDQSVKLSFRDLEPRFRRFCIDGSIILVPESGEITVKSVGNKFNNWRFHLLT